MCFKFYNFQMLLAYINECIKGKIAEYCSLYMTWQLEQEEKQL